MPFLFCEKTHRLSTQSPVLFLKGAKLSACLRPKLEDRSRAAVIVPKWNALFRLTFARFRHSTEIEVRMDARHNVSCSCSQFRGVAVLSAWGRELSAARLSQWDFTRSHEIVRDRDMGYLTLANGISDEIGWDSMRSDGITHLLTATAQPSKLRAWG